MGSVSLPAWKVVTTTTLTRIWSSAIDGQTAKNATVATAVRAAHWVIFIAFVLPRAHPWKDRAGASYLEKQKKFYFIKRWPISASKE